MSEPPTPGGKRDRHAILVRAWLRRNTGHGHPARYTYTSIGRRLGLATTTVQNAVYDLREHYRDDPIIISVPCAQNGWTVEVSWRSAAIYGAANQALHLASREASEAELLTRASLEEADPAMAFVWRNEAAQLRLASTRHRELADLLRKQADSAASSE